MPSPKVIILTGASRGIGLAMAKYLLERSHKIVVVARTAEPLEEIKKLYPQQVEVLAADLSDLSVGAEAVSVALKAFSRIDGIIVNHGTLGEVQRVCDSMMEDWRSVFDVNFFSAVSLVRAAIPSLRSNQGRVIFVSSGAATGAYSAWGAYGSSKAALNHFALTLSIEEPLITSIAVKPGVVDTDMQKAIREKHSQKMDPKDVQKFALLHSRNQLFKPEDPGYVIARLVLYGQRDFSGQCHGWNERVFEDYQEG